MVTSAAARTLTALAISRCHLLVAVSGGVDSTVLIHCLRSLAPSHDLELRIGHVNHGLRGRESEADEEVVRALGRALEIPVAVEHVAPGELRRAGSQATFRMRRRLIAGSTRMKASSTASSGTEAAIGAPRMV